MPCLVLTFLAFWCSWIRKGKNKQWWRPMQNAFETKMITKSLPRSWLLNTLLFGEQQSPVLSWQRCRQWCLSPSYCNSLISREVGECDGTCCSFCFIKLYTVTVLYAVCFSAVLLYFYLCCVQAVVLLDSKPLSAQFYTLPKGFTLDLPLMYKLLVFLDTFAELAFSRPWISD